MPIHHASLEPQRRYLLFSSIDTNRSAHDYWLAEPDRNFDIVVYVYNGDTPKQQFDLCVEKKGLKFPNFFEFSKTADLSRYDAIWIVDDDIQMRTRDINRMFELFHEYDLWLAQPAYDSSSVTSWEMLFVDNRYRIRFTNYVEVGVVLFSREALNLCLPAMRDIQSGFGADFLFAALTGFPPKKIAIIDEVQCCHPEGQSSVDSMVPRPLHYRDGEELMAAYHVTYFTPRVSGGVRR